MKKRLQVQAAALAGALVSFAPVVCLPAQGEEAISYKEALRFVDQTKTVTGTVVGTFVSRRSGNLYLNFGDYKKDLSIKIPAEDKSKFPPDAKDSYLWKRVEATGRITREQGKLRMYVTDPADLKIVKRETASEEGGAPISYRDAPDHIGQTKTVEGTVVKTFLSPRSGNFYLNFGDYKKVLSVKIPAEDRARFPEDAASLYRGKKIQATGPIVVEKKKLRMIVKDPSGIKILGEGEGAPAPAEEAQVLSWRDAMDRLGQKVVVEGTVVNVHARERGPDMLNFDKDWRNSLSVAVFEKEKFGDLEGRYLNKKIRVRGKVSEFRGAKQIKVFEPSQIEVVE